ncbi:hypothetical protein AMS68_004996 [Peltaster fructicola]|uniref:UspA domain-containing protein n=1 Tax=Peltaster fructicola TaxID=286661 RepID=A0A6H0XXY1_9PEZI|nr:hypothetical protein AMS68_004996 [Peltaster fructicola]
MAAEQSSVPDLKVNDESSDHVKPVRDAAVDTQAVSGAGATDDSQAMPQAHIQSPTSDRFSQTSSPPQSPPQSPPLESQRRVASDYYASRPKYDKFGNLMPEKFRQGATSSGNSASKIRLPGDLGPNDPRRPRSPVPTALPGDLGARDPRRPRSQNTSPAIGHRRHGSESFESPDGADRIPEDPPRPGEEDSDAEDADADNDNDSEEEGKRGRQKIRPQPGKTTAGKSVNVRDDSADSEVTLAQSKPDPTKGESAISFKLTPPTEKKRVHPSTAFDYTPSASSRPEAQPRHVADAQHSSAHRVIRQIIRGDFDYFQREAEAGGKRQRMYLVSTDLSPESEYALEWTIGTVLRDGDTLFGVYAAGEDSAASGEGGVEIGQGADSVKDTASIVSGLATNTVPPSPGPSPLSRVGADTRSRSQGVYGVAEAERRRAVESITDLCIRLLRKTTLQVRVVVEVFHCKSPRHMITELIDYLSPTLVVIGSRGRSAVKGVLLGSFSNYLVTKSSVPVMVARKKLRKHTKTVRNKDGTLVPYTGSGRTGRFSNVIEAPRGKGLRVQGWDKVGID